MPASRNSRNSRTSKSVGVRKPHGKSGAGSRSADARTGFPWKVLFVLLCISSGAVVYFWRQGYLLWYGDAAAHLNIARRLLDGRNPGYEQIGTVWLPLPHLLMMPLAAVDPLWQSGLAGSIPSALCFVAAGALLFRIAQLYFGTAEAGWAAVLLFALNPNMLYLQSLAMTEALFACTVLLTLYATARQRAALAGFGLLAGTLTRYEGWFLIPFVVLYFFWRSRRAGVVVGVIASLGPLYWLVHNHVFMGDPLEFYRGVGSAKWIYQQSIDRGLERAPGDGDWLTAAKYYAAAGRLFIGVPLAVLGALGLLAMALKRIWWPAVFLLLGPAFFVWSMYGSGATIFVPILHPFTYYNTRYGMIVLPLAALAAAGLLALVPERAQRATAILVVAIGISPWLAYPKQVNWVTWVESRENSQDRRAWTREAAVYLRDKYLPGRGIVAHFGDQTEIFRNAGIPLRQTVHDGDGLYFQAIAQRPETFLWQEWVIARPGDALARGMQTYSAKSQRYRRVKIVEVRGHPALEIWRRATP